MKEFLSSSDLLKTIVSETEANNEAARALASDLSEAQLNWKPAPEKWSIAQCLEHLAITSSRFDTYFSAALERAKRKWRTAKPVAYKPSMVGGWLAKQVDPKTGRNLPAPKVFRPGDGSSIRAPLQMFLDHQDRFREFVQRCDGIDYNKARLRSPVTPLMRYSLADAFVITVLHGRRHLAQARRVREMAEFPRS